MDVMESGGEARRTKAAAAVFTRCLLLCVAMLPGMLGLLVFSGSAEAASPAQVLGSEAGQQEGGPAPAQ